MTAVQGRDYGAIHEMLSVQHKTVAVPDIATTRNNNNDPMMLLRVLCVALAPGDVRVLSGDTRELQGPDQFPYIPGGDVCGIVVALSSSSTSSSSTSKLLPPFQVGDRVVARFTEKPMGALAEYAVVSTVVADRVPDHVTSVDAAALIGASPAVDLVMRSARIRPGERVLVYGAGGGMGAHLCQLLRIVQPTCYVVGVGSTTTTARLRRPPIQCHDAVDYTTTDVFSWSSYETITTEPFDTMIDLAGGGYQRLEQWAQQQQQQNNTTKNERCIVKPASQGGRFLTTVPPHGATYQVHSIWDALQIFLFSTIYKAIYSRLVTRRTLPKYTFCMAIRNDRTPATKMMEYAAAGQLTAVVEGPFPFTTERVRQAFALQESRHAHGKVVIRVADD